MPTTRQRRIAAELLRRYPKSHADRLRIDVAKNTPSPLYQWMIASLLFSARISVDLAHQAAKALFNGEGWRTPRKMAATTWEQRVKVLNGSGYARYDESTSRYIGESTDLLLDRYKGDLRRLRDAADGDPERLRKLMSDFKGIADVGSDIFFREVQVAWDELYPFADRKSLAVADKLDLEANARGLAGLVERQRDLPRLLSALIFADRANDIDEIGRMG